MVSIVPSIGCWAYSTSFSWSCLSFKGAGATLENGKKGVYYWSREILRVRCSGGGKNQESFNQDNYHHTITSHTHREVSSTKSVRFFLINIYRND